jgi:hypothetical protein
LQPAHRGLASSHYDRSFEQMGDEQEEDEKRKMSEMQNPRKANEQEGKRKMGSTSLLYPSKTGVVHRDPWSSYLFLPPSTCQTSSSDPWLKAPEFVGKFRRGWGHCW